MTSAGEQTVAEAGEDAVLAAIMAVAGPDHPRDPGRRLRVGPGEDDAALFCPSGNAQRVMTIDTMSQGQDFRLSWWTDPERSARDIGAKAAAQNLSDINAMGAAPEALLVSLTVPPATTVRWVQELYCGLMESCARPGAEECVIAGGDLGSGDRISVTITAVGLLPEGCAGLRRSEAQSGDVIAVSGRLGFAAAGLALLEGAGTAGQVLEWAEDSTRGLVERCLQAQMRAEPPLTAGRVAVTAGATAGMDLSDGLLRDAGRLASASDVTVVLDDDALASEVEALMPVARMLGGARETAEDWVYAGGEDYGLLTVLPPGVLPEGFRRIGEVRKKSPGSPDVLTGRAVERSGWSSF